MKKLAFVIGTILLIVTKVFVIVLYWGWFLTPLGIPAIGFATAFGISILLNVIKGIDDDSEWKGVVNLYKDSAVYVAIMGTGWIIALFV